MDSLQTTITNELRRLQASAKVEYITNSLGDSVILYDNHGSCKYDAYTLAESLKTLEPAEVPEGVNKFWSALANFEL